MYRSNITVSRQKKIYVKNRFIGNPFFDDVVDQALLQATQKGSMSRHRKKARVCYLDFIFCGWITQT